MESVVREFSQALRTLVRSPELTVAAVACLALGLGAGILVFTFLKALFFEPLPVAEPRQLVAVFSTESDRPALLPFSWPNFEDLAATSGVFSGAAASLDVTVAFDAGEGAERLFGHLVSGDYFEVLGLEPAAGRFFAAEEKRAAVPVVILSHGLWQRRFATDPGVVGKTVDINRHPFTVIGVAPAAFKGLETLAEPPDLWLPATLDRLLLSGRTAEWFDRRDALIAAVVARLAPGVGPTPAAAALDALARRLEEEHPETNRDLGFALLPLGQATLAPSERGRYLLSGGLLAVTVALLTAVAVVNVANLLLVRALGRRREIAVRLALGAGRGRLARALLTEGLLLALAGGAAGLLLALSGRRLLDALRPPFFPESFVLTFDGRVLAFALIASLGTGLLFSLAPLAQSFRFDLATALTRPAAGTEPGLPGVARSWLVAAQLALSLVVLFGAGLFLRSLANAERVDLGFDSAGLFALPLALEPEVPRERGLELFRQAVERVAALPGAHAAAVASRPLLAPGGPRNNVELPGAERADLEEVLVGISHIGPGYFETVGIPLVNGRDFGAADRDGAVRVAVVNQTLARWLWPDENALGRRFRFRGEEELTVVGVAGDAVYGGLDDPPQPYVYLPVEQRYLPVTMLHVRAAGEPEALMPAVRRTIAELDPTLPLLEPRSLEELKDRALWAPRMGAGLLSLFGFLATLLAAVGIYGVVAHGVGRRVREIGIRLALGAERRQVLRLVLGQGMRPVLAGVAAGAVIALAAGRAVAGLLFGVGAADPLSLGATALLLSAVAAAAIYLPARRASELDPAAALKE